MAGEPERITNLKTEACMAGLNTGSFLFMPAVV